MGRTRRTAAGLLLALACVAGRPVSAAPPPSPLRLGMVSPLSGDFAPYGDHIRKGIELARADLGRDGVETVVSYEDACLAAQTRAAVEKPVSTDEIEGLVASYCVVGTVPAAPILEKAGVPGFHTSVVPAIVLDAGEYVFTTNSRVRDEGAKLAEFAFGELGARKAAVLYVETQWGEEYNASFTGRFTDLGGAVVAAETSPIGVNDLRAELTRIKKGAPDVVLAVHVGPSLGTAVKQARQIGMKQQLLTVNEAEEQGVLDVAGESAENMTFFVPQPSEATEPMAAFTRAFSARFGHPPHQLSRHSYDATMLVARALIGCKRDRQCVKEHLYRVRDYPGVSGPFSIEKDGGTTREFVRKIVRGGAFVPAEQTGR